MGHAQRASEKPPKAVATVLSVPDDETPYPTLGPLVVEWMQEHLCFGPGDLLGEPLRLSDEQRAFIYRFYEIQPESRKDAGRRRFNRCALSLPKGSAKSELGALIACAELADDAPVRFNGWDADGQPKGRPLNDPFVVLVAVTEEQSDELAYGAMRIILQESKIANRFDIGLDRILRAGGHGKAISLAGSPSARDGARTTFALLDETHWHTTERLRRAADVMRNNLAKRKIAEAWALEVTTAYEPGAGSIAEDTMDYARSVHDGRTKDARLFFYHRQAGDHHDLSTEEGARAAVIEASGAAAVWRDIDAIVGIWADPTTDRNFWERVWLNRPVQSTQKAFDLEVFRSLARSGIPIPDGSLITVGFDGSRKEDATGVIATHVQSGFQWVAGKWEKPTGAEGDGWEVPRDQVNACIAQLFERFNVWRLYADPPYWEGAVDEWIGRYGDERVIQWYTNVKRKMAFALIGYRNAMLEGRLTHDGDEMYVRHIGNAHRHELPQRDENEKPLWNIRKDRAHSPYKIDLAMAGCLSWEARQDAIASGVATQGILDRGWLKYWSTKPAGGNRYIVVRGPSEKEKSEYTAAAVLELRADRTYCVLELVRDRLTLADRADLLFKLHRDYQPLRVGYTKRALEADQTHYRERQDRENYRFTLYPLDESLTAIERVKRLVPVLQAGRIVLPEKHERRLVDGSLVNMTDLFVRSEYEPFPTGQRCEMLDVLSLILDVGADFPAQSTYKRPTVFPSDF